MVFSQIICSTRHPVRMFFLKFIFSGFDFDLDEVWAPLNPHLRGFRTEASASSSASSSDNSIHSRSILPAVMQSSSVLGGPESRAATARLSERGQKKLQNQVRIELEYIHMCALIT